MFRSCLLGYFLILNHSLRGRGLPQRVNMCGPLERGRRIISSYSRENSLSVAEEEFLLASSQRERNLWCLLMQVSYHYCHFCRWTLPCALKGVEATVIYQDSWLLLLTRSCYQLHSNLPSQEAKEDVLPRKQASDVLSAPLMFQVMEVTQQLWEKLLFSVADLNFASVFCHIALVSRAAASSL